jgi:hypothetical protein
MKYPFDQKSSEMGSVRVLLGKVRDMENDFNGPLRALNRHTSTT